MTVTEPRVVDDAEGIGPDAANPNGPDHDGVTSHTDDRIELISPDSITADLVGRLTFLPVNGAAFVMQVMHPVIGDIVNEYSVFRTDPLGRATRSIDSVLRWVYGGPEAIEEGKRLRRMHQPLQMRDASGRHISALNPEAYQWVIATAFPTSCSAAPLLIGRDFTADEQAEVFRDNRRIAKIVQVPMHGYPATIEEFGTYYERMLSDTLIAHPVALELIEQMQSAPRLDAAVPPAFRRVANTIARYASVPVQKLIYLTTVGVMDVRIREILGLSWSAGEQRELERIHMAIRGAYRVLPERLTYFPLAYHARRHHDELQAMKRRETAGAAYRVDGARSSGCPM